jgi:serine/threonine protein kinase
MHTAPDDGTPGTSTSWEHEWRALRAWLSTVTDRYDLGDPLGRGGTGIVFRAFDREIGCEVALKTARALSPSSIARIKREFRARARLHHPNLVQLFDLVASGDAAFFTMELVETLDLRDWVRGQSECQEVTDVATGDIADVFPAGRAPRPPLDEAGRNRLVAVLYQIVSALHVLHGAGVIHRDLKPENVLLDLSGRVALADFSISLSIGRSAQGRKVAGTPGYMSPEQRRGRELGSSSDLYSVGAMALEALIGHLPARPIAGALEHYPEFAAIIDPLLAEDAGERPSTSTVLRELRKLRPRGTGTGGTEFRLREQSESASWGRKETRERITAALERAGSSSPVLVRVTGPSGIGKSALLDSVLRERCAARPDTLVLRGTCRPNEYTDFGAFEGVADDLCEHLVTAGQGLESLLVGIQVAALERVFPAFVGAELPDRTGTSPFRDPSELRQNILRGWCELIRRVGSEHDVVVWLDDIQWIDDDSLELLSALLSGRVRASFVVSHRVDATARGDQDRLSKLWQEFRASRHGWTDHIELQALDETEMADLIAASSETALSDGALLQLARASGGYPIFLRFVDQLDASDFATSAEDTEALLYALINRSIQTLPEAERASIDVLCVAAGPVAASILVGASPDAEATFAACRSLEQLGLVTRAPEAHSRKLMPFHDRVRQARRAALSIAAQREVHETLVARHRATQSGDFEALTHHLEALGRLDEAAASAIEAADAACTRLAFSSATSYYGKALEWDGDGPLAWDTQRKLGESLANLCIGQEAGAALERAAQLYERTRSRDTVALKLWAQAVAQYFRGGEFAHGYRLLRVILDFWGAGVPASRSECMLNSLGLRMGLAVRGRGYSPRAEASVPEQEFVRLDALWVGCTSLAHVNHALADVLSQKHLRVALDIGETSRLARSLINAAGGEFAIGGPFFKRRAEKLLVEAKRAIDRAPNDYDRGYYTIALGAVAYFQGNFPAVPAHAELADNLLSRRGASAAWERTINYNYWLFSLALLGRVSELSECVNRSAEDARARRDVLAENHTRSGYSALLWLYLDDIDGANENARHFLPSTWMRRNPGSTERPWPEEAFSTPDYHNLLADVHLLLYAKRGAAAYELMRAAWPHVRHALLHKVQFVGVDLRFLFARAALVWLAAEPPRTPDDPRLRTVHGQIAGIRRDSNACAEPYAAYLRAQVEATRNARAKELAAAAGSFRRLGMVVHAACVEYRMAEYDEDGGRAAEAAAQLSRLGIANPVRVVDMFAPRGLLGES